MTSLLTRRYTGHALPARLAAPWLHVQLPGLRERRVLDVPGRAGALT